MGKETNQAERNVGMELTEDTGARQTPQREAALPSSPAAGATGATIVARPCGFLQQENPMEPEHVRARLAYWQTRLGVESWRIEINLSDAVSVGHLNFGDVQNRRGYLTVNPRLDAERVDWLIVKELAGVLAWPSMNARMEAMTTRIDREGELLAQQIARAVMGSEPPPEITGQWLASIDLIVGIEPEEE